MKLFVKLFIYLSIPFGLFMGLMVGADHGLEAGIRYGIIEGIFFGLLMALTLGWIQRRATRKYGDVTPVQNLTVEVLASSMNVVFEKAVKALREFGAEIRKEDASAGSIEARVRASWKSYGEIVTVRIRQVGDANFEVAVQSRPRFRGTIIDYGKSRENVDALAALLTNR